jgi:hypothetical protein
LSPTWYALFIPVFRQTIMVGWQIQRGASSARSDDTKSLKSAILDWITPKGHPLNPPLARNVKIDRGFHHDRTGALLCPAGLEWSNAELVPSVHPLSTSHAKQDKGQITIRGPNSRRRPMADFPLSRGTVRRRRSLEWSVSQYSACIGEFLDLKRIHY